MFKKLLALFILSGFALALLGGCTPTDEPGTGNGDVDADRVIKIGASSSLTGPMAAFGIGENFGHRAAIDDINAEGGLYIEEYGKKLPVEFVYLDNESDPSLCASTAADLILRYEVDALVGGAAPPVAYNPISTQCDRYQTPIVLGAPFEPWWDGGPYEYAWNIEFRIGTPLEEDDPRSGKPGHLISDIFLGVTDKYADQTNKKVAVVAADDADGRGWYALFPDILEKAGYEVIGKNEQLGLYPPGTTDFTPIISEWKKQGAEIMWGNLPGSDMAVLLRQAEREGFKPKLNIAARAALFYEDVSVFGGDLPHGLMVELMWDPTYPPEACPGIGSTTAETLAQRWYEETGEPLNRVIGFGYANVQIVLDAMQKAGTLDKEAVNKAISEIDTQTITGRVIFDSTHHSPCPLFVGQWLPSEDPNVDWEQHIVFSHHDWLIPEKEPLFPLP